MIQHCTLCLDFFFFFIWYSFLIPAGNWLHIHKTKSHNALCKKLAKKLTSNLKMNTSVRLSEGWNFPLSSFLSVSYCFFFPLTWLLLPVSGVCEWQSIRGLPATDGHIFRSVCPGEVAGVSQRPAAIPSQLYRSSPRPTHFESWRQLLWRRQASDAWLWSVAVMYSWSALPCLKTKVQFGWCCLMPVFLKGRRLFPLVHSCWSHCDMYADS